MTGVTILYHSATARLHTVRLLKVIVKVISCCVSCSGHLGDDTRTALYQQLKEADGRKYMCIFYVRYLVDLYKFYR